MLIRLCPKSFKLGLSSVSSVWIENFQMYKLGLEKAEEQEIKLPTFVGSERKQNICIIDFTIAFVWITTNWTILQEMGIPDHLTCLLRNLYAGQEAAVRTRHEQLTGSKLGKDYVKAVYSHPVYLTYMLYTSGEMLGWMNHKLKSRLLGEISPASVMQMIPL